MEKKLPRRRSTFLLLLAGFAFAWAIERYDLLDNYIKVILIYMGINIMLCVSLNLINGYLGEFSVGHAGFMAVGAYTSACLTVQVLPRLSAPAAEAWLFPLVLVAGGAAAALVGVLVAIPSFKTRGDYLAIVTLAFNMIVKSVIENIDALGGPRGYAGMNRLTSLPVVYAWTAITLFAVRNFVYSNFGRGVVAIREDEIASEQMGVNTRQVKLLTFVVAAFFAGVAGGLYAHQILHITPKAFNVIKSTEILIMVYLGGIGSLAGSLLGAAIYTVLPELFRPLAEWRMVIMPLVLILLMLFRPRGIMGLREWRRLMPKRDLAVLEKSRQAAEEADE